MGISGLGTGHLVDRDHCCFLILMIHQRVKMMTVNKMKCDNEEDDDDDNNDDTENDNNHDNDDGNDDGDEDGL